MHPRALLIVIAFLAACNEESSRRSPRLSIRDSIRMRREAQLALRPDTLGARTDSARVAGSPTASVWVIVVSDFQCAVCRDVARTIVPAVRREFIDRGVARLAFVNLPQDRHFNARFAAHAALCAAAEGRFWAMHDSLFATQPQWDRMPDPRPFMDSLAVSAGVSASAQADCTARQRLLPLLAIDIERSQKSGVADVPTLVIGERRLAGKELTIAAVRGVIRDALSSKPK